MTMKRRRTRVPVASSRNYDTPGQKYIRKVKTAAAIAAVTAPFWAVSYTIFGTTKICKSEVEYNHLVAAGIVNY